MSSVLRVWDLPADYSSNLATILMASRSSLAIFANRMRVGGGKFRVCVQEQIQQKPSDFQKIGQRDKF